MTIDRNERTGLPVVRHEKATMKYRYRDVGNEDHGKYQDPNEGEMCGIMS